MQLSHSLSQEFPKAFPGIIRTALMPHFTQRGGGWRPVRSPLGAAKLAPMFPQHTRNRLTGCFSFADTPPSRGAHAKREEAGECGGTGHFWSSVTSKQPRVTAAHRVTLRRQPAGLTPGAPLTRPRGCPAVS